MFFFVRSLSIFLLAYLGGLLIGYAATFQFRGSAGSLLSEGIFFTDGRGNAGEVSFDEPGSTATLDGFNLTGRFWLQSVGWVSFDPGARILPPSGKVTDLWDVQGTITSQNAGVITLVGVKYDPMTKQLINAGMNDGVGLVPFSTLGSVMSTQTSTGFLGRVKILGNIGGNSAFDTFYDLQSKFNSASYGTYLQSVRKNVGLMTRNLSSSQKNSTLSSPFVPVGSSLFLINTGSTQKSVFYSTVHSTFSTASVRSLVLLGVDLIIDRDIDTSSTVPEGIILLKNESNLGGNVYIQRHILKVIASIFTEGSLWSGDGPLALYNATKDMVATLPESQLYLRGSIISRNTIGGALQDGSVCPALLPVACIYALALRYDLNYFRDYHGVPSERGYKDASLDAYSLIIEHDSRLYRDPPPGF